MSLQKKYGQWLQRGCWALSLPRKVMYLPMLYRAWFYEDMTDYYKAKYPDANVKAVVVRHTF